MIEDSKIQISLGGIPPISEMAIVWQALQEQSDHSFFTSWAWIGCWLTSLPENFSPLLLKAEMSGRIVGIGILFAKYRPQLKVFGTPALYLNATGDAYFDEITIEYNGFLLDRSAPEKIAKQLLDFLFSSTEYRCNEVFIHGSTNTPNLQQTIPSGTRLLAPRVRGCYSVNLDKLRESKKTYISTLGSTRRYNIRRSLKEYERLAPLKMTVAESIDEAIYFLAELQRLHQAYWKGKDAASAFGNPFFEKFVRQLVMTNFTKGLVQLIRVSVGESVLGYLLNFVYLGHVYQYQSGFDYNICEKYNSPGYVCHLYAVEHNLQCRHHTYDYMAGDSDYKKAMGVLSTELSWHVVQRETLIFKIEDHIRHAVRKLRELAKKQTFFGSKSA